MNKTCIVDSSDSTLTLHISTSFTSKNLSSSISAIHFWPHCHKAKYYWENARAKYHASCHVLLLLQSIQFISNVKKILLLPISHSNNIALLYTKIHHHIIIISSKPKPKQPKKSFVSSKPKPNSHSALY